MYRFWRAAFYSRIFATIQATRPSRLSKFSCVGNTGFGPLPTLRTYKLTVVAKVQSVRLLHFFSLLRCSNTVIVAHVSKSPRCRFHATFEGFEWFIYNRTAAFDNIVSQMEVHTPVPESRAQGSSADRAASQLRHIFTKSPVRGDGVCIPFRHNDTLRNLASHLADNVPTPHLRNPFSTPKFLRNFVQWLRSQLPDLNAKNLLPISFECFNGGIVCGNIATSNILVAEFNRADGIFGTVPVRHNHLLLFLVALHA